ncbi:hypothetical protein MLD38_012434 [Melastoma candidum]|uniref:Uncharacterized protein n=1 Tax=Melastoma candidum TaxID=119954 RepID=A0ACB9R6C3_9MYRT|nr:hypothetical protein MLD38_012434 [Melastoma candidum]
MMPGAIGSWENYLGVCSLIYYAFVVCGGNKHVYNESMLFRHDAEFKCESAWLEGSLEKLDYLFNACGHLGVTINPAIINGFGIIPLCSWYHESFDREDEITAFRIPPLEMMGFSLFL